MKNHRKLLLAGVAIVPLALSSWTSEDPVSKIRTIENQNSISSIDKIGATDVVVDVSEKNKKNVIAFIDKTDAPSKVVTTTKTLEPTTSIESIVKAYQ